MAKVGRPKSDNPKGDKFSFRLDAATVKGLDDYCRKNGVTRSEAIRIAVDSLINGKLVVEETVRRKERDMPSFLL